MEHVVFFTSPDGASLFRRTPDLDAAVRVVEHLRNVDGVEDAQVYSLALVPLSFKTYVKVEVPQLGAPVPVPSVAAPVEPEPVAEPVAESEPEPEPVVEAEPEPVVEAEPVTEPEPVAEPVAEVPVEHEPVADDASFHPAPGMDVLPSEEFVTSEQGARNGRNRGMGFFSR